MPTLITRYSDEIYSLTWSEGNEDAAVFWLPKR